MNEFNDDLLPASESLKQLAEAHGVSTEYWDYHGNLASPSSATLRAVLAALGVSINSEEEIGRALREVEDAPWRQALAPTVVTRGGVESTVPVYVPDGAKVRVRVELENGDVRELTQTEDWTVPREVDGVKRGRASFILGADLPLGWHRIIAEVSPGSTDQAAPQGAHAAPPADSEAETITVTSALAVTPNHLDLPESLGDRGWGVMTQLYSTRSRGSWGTGDTDDLTELAAFLGDQGADFLLINPLHAAEPVAPMTHSPYLPVTRRFVNPLYIRPENIPEVARLSGPKRSLVQWAFEEVKDSDLSAEPIDRDAVWKAKREALEVIFAAGRSYSRQRAFERFRAVQGEGLERCAVGSALGERHGSLARHAAGGGLRLRRQRGAPAGRAYRLLRLAAVDRRRAAGSRAGRGPGLGDGPGHHGRPRRRSALPGGGRVVQPGGLRLRSHRGGSAGHVQPAGPELVPADVEPRVSGAQRIRPTA